MLQRESKSMSPGRKPGYGVENTDRTSLDSYLRRLDQIPSPFAAIETSKRLKATRADEKGEKRNFDLDALADFFPELGLSPVDPEAVVNFFGTREKNPLKLKYRRELAGTEHHIFIEEIPEDKDKKRRIIKVSKFPKEEEMVRQTLHVHESARLLLEDELLPQMTGSDFLPSGHAFTNLDYIPGLTLKEIRGLKDQSDRGEIVVHSFAGRLRTLAEKFDIQLEFDAKDEKNFRLKEGDKAVKRIPEDKPHVFHTFTDNVLYAVQAQNLLDPAFLKNVKLLLNNPESHVSDKGKLLYHLHALQDLQEPPQENEREIRGKITEAIDDIALAA